MDVSAQPGTKAQPEPFGYVSRIAELRDKAERAAEAGRFEEAIARQRQVIALLGPPALPEGHYERVLAWRAVAQYCRLAGGGERMVAALKEAGEYAEAAEAMSRMGRHREAAEILLEGARGGGEGSSEFFAFAVHYCRQAGELKRALGLMEERIKHDPARPAHGEPSYELSELRFLVARPDLPAGLRSGRPLTREDADAVGRWAKEHNDAEAMVWAEYLRLAILPLRQGRRDLGEKELAGPRNEVHDFCRRQPDSDLAFHAIEDLDRAESRVDDLKTGPRAYEIAMDVLPPTPKRFCFLLRFAEGGRIYENDDREGFLRRLLEDARGPAEACAVELALAHRLGLNPARAVEVAPICMKILDDPAASNEEKLAAVEQLQRSYFRPPDVEASRSLMETLEAHIPPNRWPTAYVTRHADLLRRNMNRDEAIDFLKSFLDKAPDHPGAAEIMLKLAHHLRTKDPAQYETLLLAAAFHPRAETGFRAQRAAREELAAAYEAANRWKDAARVLEQSPPPTSVDAGVDRGGLEWRLRILDLKLRFMEPDKALDAMWQSASGSAYRSPSEARLAAFYLSRAYDRQRRADDLLRLASDFAAAADNRTVDYARSLFEAIKMQMERRQALRGDAPIIVSGLAKGANRWLPSLIAPGEGSASSELGPELVQALGRYPKDLVTPLLAEAFTDGPRNDWTVKAMAENGHPRLIALLLDAAKTAPDKRSLDKYIGAIAYSGVAGAEEMILDIAVARNEVDDPIIGDALAHLADSRERGTSKTPALRPDATPPRRKN